MRVLEARKTQYNKMDRIRMHNSARIRVAVVADAAAAVVVVEAAKLLYDYQLIFDVHRCSDCAKKKDGERECAIIESK